MRENMEFPTEWVIVDRDDELQQNESPQNQLPPPSPPVDEKEEDSQVLQAYIVTAGG